MTVACIVQARQGSTRLPNKVLADIAGKPMITRVLERCMAIPGVDIVVCATPSDDEELIRAASATTEVVGGSEADVLDRYVDAAYFTEADVIMRVTGDCPLIDPVICGQVLDLFLKHKAGYASNVYPDRSFPKGLDCEVFSRDVLLDAARISTAAYDREHVTPWMQRQASVVVLSQKPNRSYMRWVVDTQADLDFVRSVYAGGNPVSQEATLDIVRKLGTQQYDPIYVAGEGEMVCLLSDGSFVVVHPDRVPFRVTPDGVVENVE